jgi:hypothetical protein
MTAARIVAVGRPGQDDYARPRLRAEDASLQPDEAGSNRHDIGDRGRPDRDA